MYIVMSLHATDGPAPGTMTEGWFDSLGEALACARSIGPIKTQLVYRGAGPVVIEIPHFRNVECRIVRRDGGATIWSRTL